MDSDHPRRAGRPQRHWGLWALAFLAVSLVALLTSGNGWTNAGAIALLGGFAGAGYCSYRGLKEFRWLPR